MKKAWNFKDRVGEVVGRLTILSLADKSSSGKTMWNCICECGNLCTVQSGNLNQGHTNSCGCFQRQRATETKTTHGLVNSRTYKTWLSMKERCTNSDSTSYKQYGGVGVIVCTSWLESFENFLADMGVRPDGMTLNRVNGAKVYSKETCEWATYSVQSYDQRMPDANRSGKTGVSVTRYGSWVAYIDCNKRIHLGTFKTFEEAVEARQSAELKYFGFNKE